MVHSDKCGVDIQTYKNQDYLCLFRHGDFAWIIDVIYNQVQYCSTNMNSIQRVGPFTSAVPCWFKKHNVEYLGQHFHLDKETFAYIYIFFTYIHYLELYRTRKGRVGTLVSNK